MRVSIDERLARLCGDFSVAKIGEWLERKFASYDTSKQDVISIAENKNDKEYFKSARLLGYVRDLPDGRSGAGNRPLLVAAVEMRKILTERTSRQAQFNFAKRVLQNAVRSEEIAIVEGRGKSDTTKDKSAAKPSCRRTTRPATAADSPREEDEELE